MQATYSVAGGPVNISMTVRMCRAYGHYANPHIYPDPPPDPLVFLMLEMCIYILYTQMQPAAGTRQQY